tara:strand:- start:1922 stop:2881 length:960 start_codon:yes stop_codon:yes gene_type:complete
MSECNADEILNLFKSVGLDINKKDEDGNTRLMNAVFENNIDLVSALIKLGAIVNTQNIDGETPLMFASAGGMNSIAIMRILINAGADINKQAKLGDTALLSAILLNRTKYAVNAVQLLIDNGADVNLSYGCGITTLMSAVKSSYPIEMTELLISNGVNINAKIDDDDDYTALMFVAEEYKDHESKITKKLIHKLVNTGADIHMRNRFGKTAYDVAVEFDNKIGVKLLQQYKDNWTFNPKIDIQLQLKLWSTQNIQSVRNIYTSWKGDKHQQSGFGKLPWDLIRDIILPMTIDRRDTIKLIKKEEEKMISSRPCKRAKIH